MQTVRATWRVFDSRPTGSMDASSVSEYLSSFKRSKTLGRLIVYSHTEKGQKARYGALSTPLPKALEKALSVFGIERFFSHQAEAMDLVRKGKNVVVATPTASGKSLIYNVPILERMIKDRDARALYLFPLKALAHDQLKVLDRLTRNLDGAEISHAIYDGDTTSYRRGKIRRDPPNCLFTNPDMLHLSILPYHDAWSAFWKGLKFVVVDEVHTYRGIMGSNMGWVFRRLRRICSLYGSEPTFILSSATVGNPGELARELIGLDFQVVTKSGAPRGKRHLILVDPKGAGAAQTAVLLILAALKRGLRTICYTQSRKLTELVSLWVGQRAGGLAEKVSAYRAGFLPEERRLVEKQLSEGDLLAVISTSALELGIDIGVLDLCILVGYPGTLMSLRQRGGRVGRSSRESAVIMVSGEDALDQYFVNNPRELVDRPSEKAVVNVFNPKIVAKHLICAASESPMRLNEQVLRPRAVREKASRLVEAGRLFLSADGEKIISMRKYPQKDVDLRGTGSSYQIVNLEDGKTIGSIDGFRALRETHPGAVYLHRGQSFQVARLDIETRRVEVRPARVDYFTRVRASKDTEILETRKSRPLFGATCHWGRLLVTDQVTGYDVLQIRGQKLINRVELDLPPQRFETEGLWIEIPARVKAACEKGLYHFMGGIHALEHACIGVMPLFVLCDRNDLGGISITFHPQLSRGAIFVYDGVPGGVGLTEAAFERCDELLNLIQSTISSCRCENGCPSCVHSPKCGSGNRPIDKEAALFLLNELKSLSSSVIRRAHPRKQKEEKGPVDDVGNITFTPGTRPAPSTEKLDDKIRDSRYLLQGLRFGVLDIETQLSAKEVGGWHRAERMRVSCAVLWDSKTCSYVVFREKQLPFLFSLLRSMDLVVGFNIKRFDYRVLSAYTEEELSLLPTLDILEHVYRRLGYRLSLDLLASSTLGTKKSANGLLALKWWKEGKIRKIIDYCKRDVAITRDLFLFGSREGFLLFRNKEGSLVRFPVDWNRDQALNRG